MIIYGCFQKLGDFPPKMDGIFYHGSNPTKHGMIWGKTPIWASHPKKKIFLRFSSKDGRPKGMDVGDGVGPLPKKVPIVSTWRCLAVAISKPFFFWAENRKPEVESKNIKANSVVFLKISLKMWSLIIWQWHIRQHERFDKRVAKNIGQIWLGIENVEICTSNFHSSESQP